MHILLSYLTFRYYLKSIVQNEKNKKIKNNSIRSTICSRFFISDILYILRIVKNLFLNLNKTA